MRKNMTQFFEDHVFSLMWVGFLYILVMMFIGNDQPFGKKQPKWVKITKIAGGPFFLLFGVTLTLHWHSGAMLFMMMFTVLVLRETVRSSSKSYD